MVQHRVQTGPYALAILFDLSDGWPIAGLILGALSGRRIDAGLKESVELRMKGRHVQTNPANLIPVKRLQMAKIEH